MKSIRIGNRGSQLALRQAHLVKELLRERGRAAELVVISTYGDEQTHKPLHQLGVQGVFTKALDDALLRGTIDIAVHSCKDIPGEIPKKLNIAYILEREDPQDVLLATREISLEDEMGYVMGTSSVRRIAFLSHSFSRHIIKDVRGNLDTCIRKLESGEYDALVLAYAGVKRMGLERYIRQYLSKEQFVPMVGQGAIGLVVRTDDEHHTRVVQQVNHERSYWEVMCEREYLRTVQGGCKLPVFGYAQAIGDDIKLLAGIASLDGKVLIKHSMQDKIQNSRNLANYLGEKILNEGGKSYIYVSKG